MPRLSHDPQVTTRRASVRAALHLLPGHRHPLNVRRAITPPEQQFRFASTNAISGHEARDLYATYHVAAPGRPLVRVATTNPNRGPLLVISGQQDHTVPWAIANASCTQDANSPAHTEIIESRWPSELPSAATAVAA